MDGVIVGVLVVLTFVVGVLVGQRRRPSPPPEREAPQPPVFVHGLVEGRLEGSVWECRFGDRTFRAYSRIWPEHNEWTMQDGTVANPEEKKVLASAVTAFRESLNEPVWPMEKS